MGRSLHCHLATKRLTDPTQLIMAEVFWWQGCGGGGKRVGGWEWVHSDNNSMTAVHSVYPQALD